MTHPNPKIGSLEESFEEFYQDMFELLVKIADRKFRVPKQDAESLANEVFLGYLRRSHEVHDVRAWMIGAICHLSRSYQRRQAREEEAVDVQSLLERPDPVTQRILDSLPGQLATREALKRLPERYEQVLRLRYLDGFSIPEVAHRLGIRPEEARTLVRKSLRHFRKATAWKGPAKRSEAIGELRDPKSLQDALAGFVDAYRNVG